MGKKIAVLLQSVHIQHLALKCKKNYKNTIYIATNGYIYIEPMHIQHMYNIRRSLLRTAKVFHKTK